MEGVMMKNGSHYACAVRKPDGTIEVDDQRTTSLQDKSKFFKLPIIRGVVTFVESLKIGIKTLTWSASFFEEEEEGAAKKDAEEVSKNDIGTDGVIDGESNEASADEGIVLEEITSDIETDGTAEEQKTVKVTKSVPKEKSASEKRKEGLIMGLLVVVSIVFAVGLFMILPYFISTFLILL